MAKTSRSVAEAQAEIVFICVTLILPLDSFIRKNKQFSKAREYPVFLRDLVFLNKSVSWKERACFSLSPLSFEGRVITKI